MGSSIGQCQDVTFLSIFSTQGKLEDRKPIMLLFDDVAIDCILSAAQ